MHKVLVIDDDAFVRATIKALLDADGRFTVLEAADGREGLRVATREQPDVVLLDVDMPQMDGLTMLREMRRRPRTETTPVVMITADRSEETMAQAMGELAEQYITKPFSRANLLEKINQVLALRRKPS